MEKYDIIEVPNIKRPSDMATTVSFHRRGPGGIKVSKLLSQQLCDKYGVTRSELKVQIKILDSPHLSENKQHLSAVDRDIRSHTRPGATMAGECWPTPSPSRRTNGRP
jgi:hypothetical protein